MLGSLADFVAADSRWLRLVMDSMSEGFGILAPDFTRLPSLDAA